MKKIMMFVLCAIAYTMLLNTSIAYCNNIHSLDISNNTVIYFNKSNKVITIDNNSYIINSPKQMYLDIVKVFKSKDKGITISSDCTFNKKDKFFYKYDVFKSDNADSQIEVVLYKFIDEDDGVEASIILNYSNISKFLKELEYMY